MISMPMLARIAFMLVIALIVGCGDGTTEVPVTETSRTDSIRRNLQSIADTGQKGSEMVAIEQDIRSLAETDPEKSAELSTEFEKLKGASGTQAKSQAQKMIDML